MRQDHHAAHGGWPLDRHPRGDRNRRRRRDHAPPFAARRRLRLSVLRPLPAPERAKENIAFPLRTTGVNGDELKTRVDNVCRRVVARRARESVSRPALRGREPKGCSRPRDGAPSAHLFDGTSPLGEPTPTSASRCASSIRAQQLNLKGPFATSLRDARPRRAYEASPIASFACPPPPSGKWAPSPAMCTRTRAIGSLPTSSEAPE